MLMISRRSLLVAAALSAAFATPLAAQQPGERLAVVASFSILADIVRQIGGERVQVHALVGPNADAHVYQPSAGDARRLTEARLIIVNGLGFEGWIDRLIRAAGAKAPVIVASRGAATLAAKDDHDHDHGDGKAGALDPHAWQDVANVRVYVANIAQALTAADPAGAEAYRAQAARYTAELDALDAEIRAAVAKLPPERRRIITSHNAFGYFARAYGLDFIAPQGVSTESEASARDVARIIRQIRAEKVPAVFIENVSDPRLLERITRETGAKMGGRLWSDALSAQDGPAGTYIDMMRNNIRELTKALAS